MHSEFLRTIKKDMSGKGRNYHPTQQETLCHAWLHASLDPIVGNDQKAANFYEKVAKFFNERVDVDEYSHDALYCSFGIHVFITESK